MAGTYGRGGPCPSTFGKGKATSSRPDRVYPPLVESSVAKVNGILFMDLILALYVKAIDVANTWIVRVAER